MIKARRLFLFPAVTAIILAPLLPFSIPIWLGLNAIWYYWNSDDVNLFIKGYVYRKDEYANKDELK